MARYKVRRFGKCTQAEKINNGYRFSQLVFESSVLCCKRKELKL